VEPIIATRDRNTGILPVRLADILSASPPTAAECNSAGRTDWKSVFRWSESSALSGVKTLHSITGQDSRAAKRYRYGRHPERKRGTSHICTDYTTWFAPLNSIW